MRNAPLRRQTSKKLLYGLQFIQEVVKSALNGAQRDTLLTLHRASRFGTRGMSHANGFEVEIGVGEKHIAPRDRAREIDHRQPCQ